MNMKDMKMNYKKYMKLMLKTLEIWIIWNMNWKFIIK